MLPEAAPEKPAERGEAGGEGRGAVVGNPGGAVWMKAPCSAVTARPGDPQGREMDFTHAEPACGTAPAQSRIEAYCICSLLPQKPGVYNESLGTCRMWGDMWGGRLVCSPNPEDHPDSSRL